VAPPPPRPHGKKIRSTVTISPDLYAWVEARTGSGREFGSISHAVERGLAALRREVEKKE
jgi:Arc/MetJ-type ribon-helix-helix transcriptional regulator